MQALLRELLDELDVIGASHEELFDTVCRDRMSAAVFDAFVRRVHGLVVPSNFGLHSDEANQQVQSALQRYIVRANAESQRLGISTFHGRLAAFQDPNVQSAAGNYFDDFFGYSDPAAFDELGVENR